jgi:hypothetical protein
MVVKFRVDFRGVATAERYYVAGSVVDLPDWQVEMVLAEGVAERVVAAPAVETGAVVDPNPATAPAVGKIGQGSKPRKPRAKKAA